jgi:hypothetical protein
MDSVFFYLWQGRIRRARRKKMHLSIAYGNDFKGFGAGGGKNRGKTAGCGRILRFLTVD